MNSRVSLFKISMFGLILSSCVSNENIWTDDLYHMRSSELPEGESLTDETGYANFKERIETEEINTYYEAQQNASSIGFYSSYDPIFWGMYPMNYYPATTLFFGQGIPGFNNDMSWYGSYGYPFYSSYNNYDPFYNVYGYNPYFGYGDFNQGYGYFNNGWGANNYYGNNNLNGNASSGSGYQNYHEGPRGTIAGYSNSANRLGISTIKSHEVIETNNKPLSQAVIERFILSEESNDMNNFNYNSDSRGQNYNNNSIKIDYTPRVQRAQFADYNAIDNSFQHTNNNGSFQLRETNRVNIQTSPTRIDNHQPIRSNGAVRQTPTGKRN